jgi:hypothetical protein
MFTHVDSIHPTSTPTLLEEFTSYTPTYLPMWERQQLAEDFISRLPVDLLDLLIDHDGMTIPEAVLNLNLAH